MMCVCMCYLMYLHSCVSVCVAVYIAYCSCEFEVGALVCMHRSGSQGASSNSAASPETMSRSPSSE